MAKQTESARSDADKAVAENKDGPPVCPYCGTVCRNLGKHHGVTHFRCDTQKKGCGLYGEKRGKPKAPPYDNHGFSAR